MPALWTFGPENVTGIDLSANAFWRLTLGATFSMEIPWLTVALIYPPAAGQTILQTQITLARTGMTVTNNVEDVQRIAQVSVTSGDQEQDVARMTEAFNLFKNSPKVKKESLETSLRDAVEILRAYWKIRMWLEQGAANPDEVSVSGYTIKMRP